MKKDFFKKQHIISAVWAIIIAFIAFLGGLIWDSISGPEKVIIERNQNSKVNDTTITIVKIEGDSSTFNALENYSKQLENQKNNKEETINTVISNKEEIITNAKAPTGDQKKLEKQIKTVSKEKKPDIEVENSPNTVIQINEQGDNFIDKSTKIYASPQRKMNRQLGEQLLKMLDERLEKYNLGRNGKIAVTTTQDAESRNFGRDIVKFLIKNNYNVFDGLNTYIGSDEGFRDLDVAFRHNEQTETLELWINTLKRSN